MTRTAFARSWIRPEATSPEHGAVSVLPASRPDRLSSASTGFTFLEVLIALAICGLTVAAVASSVTTVLAAEQLNARLQEEALALRTAITRHSLPPAASESAEPLAWTASLTLEITGEDDTLQEWDLLTLTAPDGSPGTRVALRTRPSATP